MHVKYLLNRICCKNMEYIRNSVVLGLTFSHLYFIHRLEKENEVSCLFNSLLVSQFLIESAEGFLLLFRPISMKTETKLHLQKRSSAAKAQQF